MNLESQYKEYQKNNLNSNFTFEQWKKDVLCPMLKSAVKQINELKIKFGRGK